MLAILHFQPTVNACLWDSDTLADEKKARPTMAAAILGNPPDLSDPTKLRQRISTLQASRRENDPAWWNDLAGAHIRLGEAKVAAELLESVVTRFPDDYGVHANLGTAYHLLGRYAEAEKHIARDLEINPDAHFGLEKYHLALLQYLTRDAKYQYRHVYVDEFTGTFWNWSGALTHAGPDEGLQSTTNELASEAATFEKEYSELTNTNSSEATSLLRMLASCDVSPQYRTKWNLASDPKLEEGVIYMATLNPKQPACFVMLGMLCHYKRDLNLAAAAFERAIELGSPQTDLLKTRVAEIREHINESRKHGHSGRAMQIGGVVLFIALVLGGLVVLILHRKSRALASKG